MSRRVAIWVLLAVAGAGATLGLSNLAAWRTAHRETSSGRLGPDSAAVAVVIARRPERRQESDPTPHRGSLLAVYRREGTVWKRRGPEFAVRSESTSAQQPAATDGRTVDTSCETAEDWYIFGHSSVPEGVYQLGAPTAAPNTHNQWMTVTDWSSGYIRLQTAQVLRRCRAERTANGYTIAVDSQWRRESHLKSNCFLHGTVTTEWSHRDSFGCINLWHDDARVGESHMLALSRLLAEEKAFAGRGVCNLIIWRSDALPDTLEITFERNGARDAVQVRSIP